MIIHSLNVSNFESARLLYFDKYEYLFNKWKCLFNKIFFYR